MPGRFVAGGVTLTVAPPGQSKTTLALAECVQVAAGLAWAGRAVTEPGAVLYLGGEDDADEIRRRLAAVAQALGVDLDGVADAIHCFAADERPMGVNLARPGLAWGQVEAGPDVEAIKELAKDLEVKLIVFDPLIEFHALDENANREVKEVGHVLRAIAKHAGCAVHVTHHTPKSPGPQGQFAGEQAAARGASALAGSVRVMHTLVTPEAKDAEAWGIDEKDRRFYARFDMAKNNQGPLEAEPRWFKRTAVELANGETVGVLEPVDLGPGALEAAARRAERRQRIVGQILAALAPDETRVTVNQAALRLLANGRHGLWAAYRGRDAASFKGRAPAPVKAEIEGAIVERVGGSGFRIEVNEDPGQAGANRAARWLVLVEGEGEGEG
ncbi:MAG: AAA family ATPase, partial [Alphaproteobacteria bacterium]